MLHTMPCYLGEYMYLAAWHGLCSDSQPQQDLSYQLAKPIVVQNQALAAYPRPTYNVMRLYPTTNPCSALGIYKYMLSGPGGLP